MLIEFKIGNFLSYDKPVSFSMVASARTEHEDDNTIILDEKVRLLKSAIIYGANASGKSNLFKAMNFMRHFVLNSSKETQATEKIKVKGFRLSAVAPNKPSFFEIIFVNDNVRYKYGFETNSERVEKEWLFFAPKGKEALLFKRSNDTFELGAQFKEGKELADKTRKNALFLSVVAQFNGSIAANILSWFKNFKIISGLDDNYRKFTVDKIKDPNFKPGILKFLQIADLGIEDIDVERTKVNVGGMGIVKFPPEIQAMLNKAKSIVSEKVTTIHKKYGIDKKTYTLEQFGLDSEESNGTRQLFALAGPILHVLKTGKVLVIDEFDARLHPLLIKFLIKLFNSKNNRNNAQLICASHNTSALNITLFRRDQIWFAEKNQYGATDIYSLVDFKVRKDASFEKDYILGKYGAIPFVRGMEGLFEGDA